MARGRKLSVALAVVALVAAVACWGARTRPSDLRAFGAAETDAGAPARDAGMPPSDLGVVPGSDLGPPCTVDDWPLHVVHGGPPVDRVSRDPSPFPDGDADGVFETTVSGPITSLAIVTTDLDGTTCCSQEWDTIVASQSVPADLRSVFHYGYETWVVGVDVDGVPSNLPDGELVPIGAGCHALRLYAADSGYFHPGQAYRLYLMRPDGTIQRGSVSTW